MDGILKRICEERICMKWMVLLFIIFLKTNKKSFDGFNISIENFDEGKLSSSILVIMKK